MIRSVSLPRLRSVLCSAFCSTLLGAALLAPAHAGGLALDDGRNESRGSDFHSDGRWHGHGHGHRHGGWFDPFVPTQGGSTWFDGEGFDVQVPNALIALFGAPTLSGTSISFDDPLSATRRDPFSYLASLVFRADPGYTLDAVGLSLSGNYAGRRPWVDFRATGFGLGGDAGASIDRTHLDEQFMRGDRSWQATGLVDLGDSTLASLRLFGEGSAGRGRSAFLLQDLMQFDLHLSQAPIPEAGQGLMFLAGLGAIAFVLRRRRA